MNPLRCKGFTLIELLACVVIMGILFALIVPIAGRSLEFGRRTKCLSNLKQIGVAAFAYAADHDGFFPSSEGSSWDISWPATLINGGYLSSKDVLACPTARTKESASFTDAQKGYGQNPPCDYAINAMVGGSGAFAPKGDPDKALKPGHPSEAGLFVDGCDFGWYWAPWGDPFAPEGFGNTKFRHNKGLNILFADGHVATRYTKSDFPKIEDANYEGDETYYFWNWAF